MAINTLSNRPFGGRLVYVREVCQENFIPAAHADINRTARPSHASKAQPHHAADTKAVTVAVAVWVADMEPWAAEWEVVWGVVAVARSSSPTFVPLTHHVLAC